MSEELNESMNFYLESLKEEYLLYRKLSEATKRERKAIEALEMRELSTILAEKQELLNRVTEIDKKIANLREVWKEAKSIIDPKLSKEIQSFLEEFSAFMKDLVAYESENEKIFLEKNEAKEKELGEVRKARKVNQTYFKKPEAPPKQTNILG